jgi:hypothetical protein
MNIGHIQGGTHAGWRLVKQPRQWTHDCPPSAPGANVVVKVTLSSYSCPCCGARRPN